MMLSWLCFWKPRPLASRRSPRQDAPVKLTLERLETREVPSANPLDALLGNLNPGVVPISFNFVAPQGNQLTVIGQIGVNSISTSLTLTASAGSNGAEILHLNLNPIHLDVLGLNVQTGPTCLDITAQQGSGNPLENILFNIAHALDINGGDLGGALLNVGLFQGLIFDREIATLLNGSLNAATAPSALHPLNEATGLPPGATGLVHLSSGPTNLNLLGMNVNLNNCDTTTPGPVVIDAYAQSGLLGNLLTTVAHLVDPSQMNSTGELVLGAVVNRVLTVV